MTEKDKNTDRSQIDVSHVPGASGELDAAGRSLTDALRLSFVILKVFMIILVILFLTSGIFEVQEGERAMVLRLGKIRQISKPGQTMRVLDSGLWWTWPAPISEIIKIPVDRPQTMDIDSFWYFQTPQEKLNRQPSRGGQTLDPIRDGYCLTRNDSSVSGGESDYNIVHCKWQLVYKIQDPEKFFRNIYYPSPQPGQDFLDVASETVVPLLNALAGDAIVATMVHYSIDDATSNVSGIPNDVKRRLAEKLKAIDSGIIVEDILLPEKITWPRQVNDAFLASNKASQDKARMITEAESYARKTMNQAGGEHAEDVLNTLKDDSVDQAERERLLLMLAGSAQEQITEARAYRMRTVEEARANADYLESIYQQYKARPELVVQEIYWNTIEQVLDNVDEKIIVRPSGGKRRELRVLINRDTRVLKARQEQQDQQAGQR